MAAENLTLRDLLVFFVFFLGRFWCFVDLEAR